jgi:hypothetical protein
MASSQLFKEKIPIDIFLNFIKEIAKEQELYYTINNYSFRYAKFHDYLQPFCNKILNYYHVSKRFYVIRPLDYKKFITIIRQICNSLNIPYKSVLKYNKSTYDISYNIYKLSET